MRSDEVRVSVAVYSGVGSMVRWASRAAGYGGALFANGRLANQLATSTHDSIPGDLLGDLLVRPKSACGDTGDDQRLACPTAHLLRLTRLHHFDLLNHPAVYARPRERLATAE